MELTIDQALQKANIAYKNNNLDVAESFYRQILSIQPMHAKVHNNLGVLSDNRGKFEEAEKSFRKAIELKPDYVEAYFNLGFTLKQTNKFSEAEKSFRKVIQLKPDNIDAYINLSVSLECLGRLDEAEASLKKALELKPDHATNHYNLGLLQFKYQKLDEAEASFKKAIEFRPDHAEFHSCLGNTQRDKGDLITSINTFKQALKINPNFINVLEDIYYALQAVKLQNSTIEDYLPPLNKKVSSKHTQIAHLILRWRLKIGSPSAKSLLYELLSNLSSTNNNLIKNPKMPSSQLISEPTPPKKITALIVFGKSGTGLLHSLIDGHSEVSTLPSIYFSEFFDHIVWKNITMGGWEEMADRFATTYPVLFDSSSAYEISKNGTKLKTNIGRDEGMMNVGLGRDEVLSIDKKVFIKELKKLIDYHDQLDALAFFRLVHSAYEKALPNPNEKKIILYHLHDTGTYSWLNFLSSKPNTNWLMMVREPIQSCESWIRDDFNKNNYKSIADKIIIMLFEIDQPTFNNNNSVGVKLEDLKEHPKEAIPAICNWLGIKEEESLYKMTVQGKKWWGDPASPDYNQDGMNPFGKISINRKLGSYFSKNDQYILKTLYYPFSVRFGYAEENLEKFKNDLHLIRPMLDQIFDFEKKIAQNTKTNTERFMKSGSYLYLRSSMIERWNTLNKLHTYPNMITPLKIN